MVAVLDTTGSLGLPPPRRVHWFTVVATTAGAVAVASVCVWPLWSSEPKIAAPTVLFAGALIAAAVILRGEPEPGPGPIALFLAGALWPLGWLNVWDGWPAPLLADLAGPLALVLTAWAIYRYPDPQQVGEWERWFLRALALWIVVGRVSVALTSDPGRLLLAYVSAGGVALLALIFLVQWFWRVRRIRGLDRAAMGPVVVAALVAGIASAAAPLAQLARLSEPALSWVFAVQSTLLLAVPIAFAVAALRRRLASTVIAGLVAELRGEPTPEHVEQAFRNALADPGLQVYYWSADLRSHVDHDGQVFDETSGTAWLLLPVTNAANEPLAMVRADRALSRYPDLVAAAVSVGALAIENARLQVAIRAQLAQVRASRARIIEAGLVERQALERDLHTGALTRILTLIESLSAEANRAPPRLSEIAQYAAGQLTQAAAELQDIAKGLHPPILSAEGLVEAVGRISRAQPIPVLVDLPRRQFPIGVEVAAYYVVSEAITNAVRHADAAEITVKGVDTGTMLRLTIVDDGRGGANARLGTGLAGLSERLLALEGGLSIRSPKGEGTTLVAEIPCE